MEDVRRSKRKRSYKQYLRDAAKGLPVIIPRTTLRRRKMRALTEASESTSRGDGAAEEQQGPVVAHSAPTAQQQGAMSANFLLEDTTDSRGVSPSLQHPVTATAAPTDDNNDTLWPNNDPVWSVFDKEDDERNPLCMEPGSTVNDNDPETRDIFDNFGYGIHDFDMPGFPGETADDVTTSSFGYLEYCGDDPIAAGLDCKKGELLSLVVAYVLRHQCSKVALQDLLKLLNIMVPGCVPATKYVLEKYFFQGTRAVVKHYYCHHCSQYICSAQDLKSWDGKMCIGCKQPIDAISLEKQQSFFLTKPLKEQLRHSLENENLWDQIEKMKRQHQGISGSFSEILTGKEYRREELQNWLTSGDNFSIAFNFDGVPIFKSSGFSVWPIIVTINEVPFHRKRITAVLHTLWFGNQKPERGNTVLKPFVDDLRDLFNVGLEWTDSKGSKRISKVICLVGVCDAPARALAMNVKQFNGYNGCEKCDHPGERVEKGAGSVTVFPLSIPPPASKSKEFYVQCAREALETGKNDVSGIRGPSELMRLPLFDIVKGMPSDYMHCLVLGICRQFVNLWLDNPGTPYYISNVQQLDSVILDIKPAEEVKRLPRSFERDRKFFKASEYRNFVVYYSPVALRGLLPAQYYYHWMLFVSIVRILLSKNMSTEDLRRAKLLAIEFIVKVRELYGVEHVSYNVHQLLHVVDFVSHWGSPWAYSGFVFEDLIGEFKTMFSGTRYVPFQIFSYFSAKKILFQYASAFMPRSSDCIQDFYESLVKERQTFTYDCLPTECIGKGEVRKISVAEQFAIEQAIGRTFECGRSVAYSRVAINGKIFCTKAYAKKNLRDNSIVFTDDTVAAFVITDILVVCTSCKCTLGSEHCAALSASEDKAIVIICTKIALKPAPQLKCAYAALNLTEFMYVKCTPHSSVACILPQHIRGKYVSLKKSELKYYLKLDRRFEKD